MSRTRLIAHVLNGLKFGGNENLCLQLIKHSAPHIKHVLFNLDPARVEMQQAFLDCPGLEIVDVPYSRHRRVQFVLSFARELLRLRPDGVLVQPFGVHLIVALAARLVGFDRVLTHAGNPPPLDEDRRRLWKRIVIASRYLKIPIMSCSIMVDREFRQLAGELPAGSEPIFNGVDIELIEGSAAHERAQREPGSPRVVGMVARLNQIKDHDTLVRAFALVHRELPNTELWIIGDGERRPPLEVLAKQLGIAGVTKFWGERLDVHQLLGKLDVFVFSTSRDEGFGIALAEAMAARVPIVASDVGACREVLADGAAGWLVPFRDSPALATAISKLLTDGAAASELAERGFARVQEKFDIRSCAQRYYDTLLD